MAVLFFPGFRPGRWTVALARLQLPTRLGIPVYLPVRRGCLTLPTQVKP